MRIFKYELSIKSEQKIAMPAPGNILSVGARSGNFVLWAEVDPDQPQVVSHTIIGLTTGESYCGTPKRFLGTVMIAEGRFVMHFFEKESIL